MEYEYWLAAIPYMTAQKKKAFREEYGSAEALYNIEEKELKKIAGNRRGRIFFEEKDCEAIVRSKMNWNTMEKYKELEKKNIRFLPYFLSSFPEKLKIIPNVPYALYLKGNFPDENLPSVAIVGARKCSPYGEKYAWEFAKVLAEHGVQIISGLAKGIDGISQRGALEGGGSTFAVLGCGPDICYPREHIGLYTDIQSHRGGILSEWMPGTQPSPYHFPLRNRIISGLADIVLVIDVTLTRLIQRQALKTA